MVGYGLCNLINEEPCPDVQFIVLLLALPVVPPAEPYYVGGTAFSRNPPMPKDVSVSTAAVCYDENHYAQGLSVGLTGREGGTSRAVCITKWA